MSNYDRTTRECPVSQLHPELLLAIQNYFQENKLGVLESETLTCCETISRRKSPGRLLSWLKDESDTTIHMGMLLTAQKLIWVQRGDRSGILLTAANLNEIQVRSYSSSVFAKDTGLEISGFVGDSKSRVRGYIGMGAEVATQKFCEEVEEAIVKMKPPSKRRLPKWLGG